MLGNPVKHGPPFGFEGETPGSKIYGQKTVKKRLLRTNFSEGRILWGI